MKREKLLITGIIVLAVALDLLLQRFFGVNESDAFIAACLTALACVIALIVNINRQERREREWSDGFMGVNPPPQKLQKPWWWKHHLNPKRDE